MANETLTIVVRAEDFYALRRKIRELTSGGLEAKLRLIPSLPIEVAAEECLPIIQDLGRVSGMARILMANAVIKEVG